MRIRILGSAAGGGLPQWNCYCPVCSAARRDDGSAVPRLQSSIAFAGDDERWFLVNASPDLRAQLDLLPEPPHSGMRALPVAGVFLTDAEIDHTAGLLLLRESTTPLQVFSTDEVRAALTDDYPILRMLESYSGVRWSPLPLDAVVSLGDAKLDVEAFAVGGDAPLYMRDPAAEVGAIGLTVTDSSSGKSVTYVPGLAALDEAILARFEASECVLVDGTFWRQDELVELGIGTRAATDMGHLPVGPPAGTLSTLGGLRARTILVHINNTNPILLEDSPERALVVAAGVEVGHDGLEIDLS